MTMALLQAAARAVAAVAKRVWRPVPKELAVAALAGAAIVFAGYTVHSVWVRRHRPAVLTIYAGHDQYNSQDCTANDACWHFRLLLKGANC